MTLIRFAAGMLGLLLLLPAFGFGQTPFQELPGHEEFRSTATKLRAYARGGRVEDLLWQSDETDRLYFRRGSEHLLLDFETGELREIDKEDRPEVEEQATENRTRRRYVPRAQQAKVEESPDGNWEARYDDYNVKLVHLESKETTPVTIDGERLFRFGTACWVYGEELDQQTAMWWSPDSRKLAYYEIDERHMKEYHLTMDNTELYTTIYSERYPKPGEDNPYVGLLIYDLADKTTTRVDVGEPKEWYIYNIRFSPNGDALIFSRTNRHQSHLQVMAADPETGDVRLVVEEKQETWQNNAPTMQFLADGERFIWETERNGYRHYELRNLAGERLNPLSEVADYPCHKIVEVDEEAGLFYYTASSGDHPLNEHLHRVKLDGTDARRLTSQPLNHSAFRIAPNHEHFVCRYEAVDTPPVVAAYDMQGNEVAVLAETDISKAVEEGIAPSEMFSFTADDGETTLYGVLHKPTNFDPSKKYPLVISVYGGPSSRAIYNRFTLGNPYCEFGFLVARIDNRGTTGRGKAFESANYLNLGGVDLKDQVDGVKFLCERDYVDGERVGIYGHSYGGYMSALAILKYPNVFDVAVAGAPVTDWRNYDTIYTERYMRTPAENEEGYSDGSCMTYTEQLDGKLLILHGLIDDNVHPVNSWQLINKLQSENQRFDLMVYPRSKHGLIPSSNELRWEYLHEHLQPEL